MATILLTWEMGGGLGHLMQLLPLAQRLAQRGHRLVGVFKDLSRVRGLFPPELIRLFQAPVKTRQEEHPFQVPRHFGHIIHNMGFATRYADFDPAGQADRMADAIEALLGAQMGAGRPSGIQAA